MVSGYCKHMTHMFVERVTSYADGTFLASESFSLLKYLYLPIIGGKTVMTIGQLQYCHTFFYNVQYAYVCMTAHLHLSVPSYLHCMI